MTVLLAKPYLSGVFSLFPNGSRLVRCENPRRSKVSRMSEASANHLVTQNPREIATSQPTRCVAGIPGPPDAGGMTKPPANQPVKPKTPPPAPARQADVRMVLARAKLIGAEAKRIRAVAHVIVALTGLLLAVLRYGG